MAFCIILSWNLNLYHTIMVSLLVFNYTFVLEYVFFLIHLQFQNLGVFVMGYNFLCHTYFCVLSIY